MWSVLTLSLARHAEQEDKGGTCGMDFDHSENEQPLFEET